MSTQKIIIIGAPRSGTNMLRDLLTKLEKVVTWPCDEINYIWRHGYRSLKTDEFSSDMATDQVKKFVRNQFQKISNHYNCNTVIEKTCANSLRVDFVNEIVPDAKYIFIIRDGLDIVSSAKKRWTAKIDFVYLLKKARYVPKSDLFFYFSKYLSARVYKLFSKEDRLSIWGPQINNVSDLLTKYSLEEVCALQWQKCVENATKSLESLPKDRVFMVRYEEFVHNPSSIFLDICAFLNLNCTEEEAEKITALVSDQSIGKGRKLLASDVIEKLNALIGNTLTKHGYK